MGKLNTQERKKKKNKFNQINKRQQNVNYNKKNKKINDKKKYQIQQQINQNISPIKQNKNNYKQKSKSKNQQKGSKKKGKFSHLLGKSIFKVIPEDYHGDQQDKFAALNGNKQKNSQSNQQSNEIESEQQKQNRAQQFEQNDQEEIQQFEQFQNCNQLDEQEKQQQQQNNHQNQQQQYQNQIKNENQQQQYQINQQQQDLNVDISIINLKIQQTLQILMNIQKLGEGKPRKYFMDKLISYAHRYYGYNIQLIEHFLNFLNPSQMIQFFESNETQRPMTIRTNTLKIRRKQLAQLLIQRGVNLDPLAEWSKVGIKIYDTKVSIGATPEYLAGYYMLQSASSFLPVLVLDPQMNERILDLASAPGGKTTYIAQLMKNTGTIFANDLKKDRLRALQFNLSRLGVSNTVITCRDGRKYHEIFPNTFDRVLLDAPCTGLGVISKDPSIKTKRVLLDLYKNSHLQKQLLLSAIDCTKIGGIIVYSTCSISPLQNQQVINYALKKRDIKIVDMDNIIDIGDQGVTKFIDKRYHIDLKKTKRIYPHVHNMDGFYFAKLVKSSNLIKNIEKVQNQNTQ